LLNCVNGTIDLRTGTLRPHRQEDLITKQVPVAFDADAHSEEWEQFLMTAMQGDAEVTGFLQRAVGYTLTGDDREEVLFFLHGKTGKRRQEYVSGCHKDNLATTPELPALAAFRKCRFLRRKAASRIPAY
jgi:putative DNA primase/helicase